MKSEITSTDEKAVQQRRSQCWIYDMDAHIIDTDEDIRPFLDERYQQRKGSLLLSMNGTVDLSGARARLRI